MRTLIKDLVHTLGTEFFGNTDPVFLLIYVLGFALVSAIVYTIEKVTVSICSKIKHRND